VFLCGRIINAQESGRTPKNCKSISLQFKKRTNRAIAICALFTKMQVFEKSFENSVSFSTFFALYIVGEDIILPQTVVENHLITRMRGSFPSRGSLT